MMVLLQIFTHLAKSGIDSHMDRRLARALLTINWICVVITLLNVFFCGLYLATGQLDLIPSTLPTPLTAAFVLFLNRHGLHALSRNLIVLFSNASILACTYYFGQATTMHNFFFPAAACPFLIFTTRERASLLCFSLLPLILYLCCSHNIHGLFTGQWLLSSEVILLVRVVIEVASIGMATLICLILYVVVDDYHNTMVREQQDKIEHTRLESLATMAGGIAHEVNNPLAIIAGRADQLVTLSQMGLEPARATLISESIKKQVRRISEIVTSLLTIAQDGKDEEFTKLSLQELVEKALVFFREGLQEQGVKLIVQDPGAPLWLSGHEVELTRAIINIIDNAMEAVRGRDDKWIELTMAHEGEWLTLRIVDSGAGIPPEMKPLLMQPFFTTRKNAAARGLGLSTAKRIMDQHHGSLWLDTQHAHTCFVLAFPGFKSVDQAA